MCRVMYVFASAAFCAGFVLGCGDSGDTEADRIGVGAECTDAAECESADEGIALECLTDFAGGYCGLEGCTDDNDCPEGSACVMHDVAGAAANYCFRICAEKPDCNRNRSAENEANCSSNVVFVDGRQDRKACVPPSSGI